MQYFGNTAFVLLICLIQTSAAFFYRIVISEFTSLYRGYHFEMRAVGVDDFVLTIKCEDCNRYAVTYNSASIMAMGNRWNTDTCYREFCVKSLPPPADFDFKAVSKKDWVDGISFRVRLRFRTKAKLSLCTRSVLKENILPTFLVPRRFGNRKKVVIRSEDETINIQAYSANTNSRTITVDDYPRWIIDAAKSSLEAFKVLFPEEIPRLEGFRALFQFAGKYGLIAVQKMVISAIYVETPLDQFSDLVAAVSTLEDDRFGLVQKMMKMLAAHYCQNMGTMSLGNIVQEAKLKLSCKL